MYRISPEYHVCGNRVFAIVTVTRAGRPAGGLEVWLRVNGELQAADVTDPGGRAHFMLRLPFGVYRVQPLLYRAPVERDGRAYETLIEGPTHAIIVLSPRPGARAAGDKYCSDRALTLAELPLYRRAALAVKARYGLPAVYLVGGLVERGYTCHDVDFYIPARLGVERREEIARWIRSRYCLPADVYDDERPPRRGEVVRLA